MAQNERLVTRLLFPVYPGRMKPPRHGLERGSSMRRNQTRFVILAAGVPLWLAVFAPPPAFAQFGGGGGGGGDLTSASRRNLRGTGGDSKQQAAPPVLPGTKSSPEAAAPTLAPADLSPTDALFDAINRGDLTAARDAVNRGANMDQHNVLGLTALDLAIDLGRNEISFLLLSFRPDTAASGRNAARAGGTQTASADPAPRRRGRYRGETPAIAAEAAAPATPRLHAGNGGAPVPGAGFLGFNPGRN